MHITEAHIKSCLDGIFWTFDKNNLPVRKSVNAGYIPGHSILIGRKPKDKTTHMIEDVISMVKASNYNFPTPKELADSFNVSRTRAKYIISLARNRMASIS